MDHQFIIISAQRRRYLVRIADIQEIVSMMTLTPVDGQGGACRGMANLRGQVIPIFDLSGAAARLAASRFILICRIAGNPFGFIVDEVFDVVRIAQADLQLQPIGGGRTMQMTRLGDEVLAVLEPSDALSRVA